MSLKVFEITADQIRYYKKIRKFWDKDLAAWIFCGTYMKYKHLQAPALMITMSTFNNAEGVDPHFFPNLPKIPVGDAV